MSGVQPTANPAVGRPLDGRVRRHHAAGPIVAKRVATASNAHDAHQNTRLAFGDDPGPNENQCPALNAGSLARSMQTMLAVAKIDATNNEALAPIPAPTAISTASSNGAKASAKFRIAPDRPMNLSLCPDA
jgi:hypothetical protein